MNGRTEYRETPRPPPRPEEPARPRPALDARMRASLISVALCGVALSAAALPIAGLRAAFSVAVGAGIAAGNLWLLARIIAALLGPSDPSSEDPEGRRGGGRWAWAWPLAALVKMFALFALVWLLMRYEVVSPIAMLVGFGALPVGIALPAFFRHDDGATKTRKP